MQDIFQQYGIPDAKKPLNCALDHAQQLDEVMIQYINQRRRVQRLFSGDDIVTSVQDLRC